MADLLVHGHIVRLQKLVLFSDAVVGIVHAGLQCSACACRSAPSRRFKHQKTPKIRPHFDFSCATLAASSPTKTCTRHRLSREGRQALYTSLQEFEDGRCYTEHG